MAQLKDLLVEGKSRFIDKIYASDQFISKVVQGTSPFLIDSSTLVSNLNADLLDGVHESSFFRYRGNIDASYVDLTNYAANADGYQNPLNGIYSVQRNNHSCSLIAFTGAGSASGLDVYFHYSKGGEFKFRRRIDNNRLSGAWETFITDQNFSSYLGYIGTTAVQASQLDGQNITGIGTILWPRATKEILRFSTNNSTWYSGLKYSWSSNTTVALWGKHANTQFVWHAGTDFTANDVNGTSNRGYDFQVGRIDNNLEVRSSGIMNATAFVEHNSTPTNVFLLKPKSATYITTTSSVTGAITITLPASIGNTMTSMWIDVYLYSTNKSFSVHVGGYTYNNSTWANNPFAMVYGAEWTVRLGHNGTNFIIYIGETNTSWAYPQVAVRDVICGYGPSSANWEKDFAISFSTSFSNVTATITNYALTTKNILLDNVLTLKAGAYTADATWTYPGGSYASVKYPNMRLIGDPTYGLSTIEFISQKGDTVINKPTDCAFIQFQPYGVTTQTAIGTQPTLASSGEANRLVIGVNNDSNDTVVLQTPAATGLKHAVGTGLYTIWDSGNDGSGSGLDADLLDGLHGTDYVERRYGRFYPFVKSDPSRSVWHKVTFPHTGYTSTSNAWFMLTMEIVLSGSYQNAAAGKIFLNYYFLKDSSNNWSAVTVKGVAIGTHITSSGVKIRYDIANPAIFYIKVSTYNYTSFAIENLSANDTAQNFDYRTTTIEAIAEGDIPAAANQYVPIAKIETNDGSTLIASNLTATYAKYLNLIGSVNWSTAASLQGNGIAYYADTTTSGRPVSYGSIFQMSNVNFPIPGTDQHWVTQIISGTDETLHVRWRTNTGNWSNTVQILTSANRGYIGTTAVRATSAAGQDMTGIGTMYIQGTAGTWREGIRIKPYGSWATIVLGGDDLTADSGTSANSWSIHNNNGKFYIAKNGSNSSSSSILSNVSNKWYLNTASGSEILNVGGWINTVGQCGWYNSTYGGGIWMNDSTYVRIYNGKYLYTTYQYYDVGNADYTIDHVYASNDKFIRPMAFSTFGNKLRDSGYLDGRYLRLSGGTMDSGGQIIVGTITNSNGQVYSGGIQLRELTYSTTSLTDNSENAPGITFHWGGRWVHKLNLHTNDLYWDNSKVWHASNDGSGSGLDADLLDGYHVTSLLRKVTVPNNAANDFNTFESMTLTGRGDPTTGASLSNAPWTGAGPAGGYGVLTYLWSGYGTQLAFGYNNNKVYIRNKYYYNSGANWSTTWDSLLLTSEFTTSNITGILPISKGGTGASTAAGARANLGTWTLVNDSYPTLMPADGTTNNWVKIGTSNTGYGIIPSVAGGAGSGHNYIGTSSWYWKYAYIDEIHGTLKGKADTAAYADAIRDPVYYTYSSRRNSANLNWADGGLHYYLATSTMTAANGKPSSDGHILHMSWDNGSYEGQLTLPTSTSSSMQWRSQNGGTWSSWITVLDSSNYSSYLSDTKVTQTITASSNTSWRPLLLGYSYSDAATFTPTTVTNTTYATHLAKFKPSTGQLAIGGLYKMNTNGTVATGANDEVWNTNGTTVKISTLFTTEPEYLTMEVKNATSPSTPVTAYVGVTITNKFTNEIIYEGVAYQNTHLVPGTTTYTTNPIEIPPGIEYVITCSYITGYATPEPGVFLSIPGYSRTVNLNFTPVRVDILSVNFANGSAPSAFLTYTPASGTSVIQWIRNNSHRYAAYFAKLTSNITDGNGNILSPRGAQMYICQLKDSDSTRFANDNSYLYPTDASVENGDIYMRLPEFYYRVSGDSSAFTVEFADVDPKQTGFQKWDSNNMIAVYLMSSQTGILVNNSSSTKIDAYVSSPYFQNTSISGNNVALNNGSCVLSSATISSSGTIIDKFAGGVDKASIKNLYPEVDVKFLRYKWIQILRLLFMAYYKTTDAVSVCGTSYGSSYYKPSDKSTQGRGMNDTTSSTGNGSPCNFWGVEELWGLTSIYTDIAWQYYYVSGNANNVNKIGILADNVVNPDLNTSTAVIYKFGSVPTDTGYYYGRTIDILSGTPTTMEQKLTYSPIAFSYRDKQYGSTVASSTQYWFSKYSLNASMSTGSTYHGIAACGNGSLFEENLYRTAPTAGTRICYYGPIQEVYSPTVFYNSIKPNSAIYRRLRGNTAIPTG